MKLKSLTSLVAAVVTSGLVGVVLAASQEPVAVQAVPLVQTTTTGVDREDQPNRSEERKALESASPTPTAEASASIVAAADVATDQTGQAGESAGEGGGKYLSMPVAGARLSSPFGMRLHPVLRIYRLHTGQDWAASCGTPVGAAGPGTVIKSGWSSGYGLQVKIDHGTLGGYNVVSTYNHLSSVSVSQGDTVAAQQGIGRVGSTGMSTGCHLHFEVLADGTFTDPMAWINGTPVTIDTSNQVDRTPSTGTSGDEPGGSSSPKSSSSSKKPSPSKSPSSSKKPSPKPSKSQSAPSPDTPSAPPSSSDPPSASAEPSEPSPPEGSQSP